MTQPTEPSLNTKPKPFVFVLMPFEDKFTEIYQLGIRTACENAGAYCERVDEQMFHESILARIYNQIAKADIIVSDMTDRNPNVFYETGFAHALNKQVVLLTQSAGDIPFDLKHYSHIVYDGKIIKLREQLEPKIRWCVENPQQNLASVDVKLQILVNQTSIEGEPEIKVTAEKAGFGQQFALAVSVHNLGSKVLQPDSFSLAILLPEVLLAEPNNVSSRAWLSDRVQLLNLDFTHKLFPKGWNSTYLYCRIAYHQLAQIKANPSIPIVLRLFTELGPRDFPITIKIGLDETGSKENS